MSDTGSVTHWLNELNGGSVNTAQQALWQRYFVQLVALARGKLVQRRAADEEDVALSALDSFFRGATDGRFPQLEDRTSLWPLLVTITQRKAINQYNREQAKK